MGFGNIEESFCFVLGPFLKIIKSTTCTKCDFTCICVEFPNHTELTRSMGHLHYASGWNTIPLTFSSIRCSQVTPRTLGSCFRRRFEVCISIVQNVNSRKKKKKGWFEKEPAYMKHQFRTTLPPLPYKGL